MFKFIYDMFIDFVDFIQDSAETLAIICLVIASIALVGVFIEALYVIRKSR